MFGSRGSGGCGGGSAGCGSVGGVRHVNVGVLVLDQSIELVSKGLAENPILRFLTFLKL